MDAYVQHAQLQLHLKLALLQENEIPNTFNILVKRFKSNFHSIIELNIKNKNPKKVRLPKNSLNPDSWNKEKPTFDFYV